MSLLKRNVLSKSVLVRVNEYVSDLYRKCIQFYENSISFLHCDEVVYSIRIYDNQLLQNKSTDALVLAKLLWRLEHRGGLHVNLLKGSASDIAMICMKEMPCRKPRKVQSKPIVTKESKNEKISRPKHSKKVKSSDDILRELKELTR